jgi:hypothetical protein
MAKSKHTTESLLPLLKSKNLKPLTPYPGYGKSWELKCLKCGKKVQKSLQNLRVSKSGCIYCSYKGQSKYTTESLLPLLKSKNLKPLTPFPGNISKPWKCECLKCANEVAPAPAALFNGQGGCYICGRSYKFSPALIYLIHNKNLKTIKIGITNKNAHRLTSYSGWDQIRLIPFKTGKDALQLESAVLELWRIKLKLPIKLNKRDLKQGGYTETADEKGLNEAIELMDNWQTKKIPKI